MIPDATTQTSVNCPFVGKYPKILRLIGSHTPASNESMDQPIAGRNDIWIEERELLRTTTASRVIQWDPISGAFRDRQIGSGEVKHLGVAQVGDSLWFLEADTKGRVLMEVDPLGACKRLIEPNDLILNILPLDSKRIVASLFAGEEKFVVQIEPQALGVARPCRSLLAQASPVGWSLRQEKIPTLKSALAATSLWQNPSEESVPDTPRLVSEPRLDASIPSSSRADTASKPAEVRLRPAFAVPWLDTDAGGSRLGILSVR